MPKLPKKIAKSVSENEGGDFDLLPQGAFVAKLEVVEAKDGRATAEEPEDVKNFGEGETIPYWSWQFTELTGLSGEDVEVGKVYPGKLWTNTSLGVKSEWKMKEVFDAFGYSTDSDTDEMVGEKVKIIVVQEVAQFGKRKGEKVNQIDEVLPYDPDSEDTF